MVDLVSIKIFLLHEQSGDLRVAAGTRIGTHSGSTAHLSNTQLYQRHQSITNTQEFYRWVSWSCSAVFFPSHLS